MLLIREGYLLTEIPPTPEKIVERKTIVYKTLVDPTIVKLTGEKMKNKMFAKFGLLKPKPEDIRCVSIDKYYEPYIIADGKYTIDYYRKRVYTIEVDEEVREVIILNHTFKPEAPEERPKKPQRVVKLEAEERLSYEDKAYLILDRIGREVALEQMPSAPSEDKPEEILAEIEEKVRKLEMAPNKEINILKSKIVKRPPDIKRVVEELFEVSERAIIYTPVYEIAFENVRSGEVKTVEMDGVTAKMLLHE